MMAETIWKCNLFLLFSSVQLIYKPLCGYKSRVPASLHNSNCLAKPNTVRTSGVIDLYSREPFTRLDMVTSLSVSLDQFSHYIAN